MAAFKRQRRARERERGVPKATWDLRRVPKASHNGFAQGDVTGAPPIELWRPTDKTRTCIVSFSFQLSIQFHIEQRSEVR